MRVDTPMICWHTKQPILAASFHSSGRIATAGADNTVKIWKFDPKATVSDTVAAPEEQPVKHSAHFPHKKKKRSSEVLPNINLFNVEFITSLTQHTKSVNVVRFSPDGSCLASAGDDGVILLWRLEPPTETGETKAPTEPLSSFATDDEAPKENWVLCGTLRGHVTDIYDLSWSPSGTGMVSGSVDGFLLIWDVPKGQVLQRIKDHTSFVQGVCWDPLARYISSQSVDRTCRIYEINRGRGRKSKPYTAHMCLKKFQPHAKGGQQEGSKHAEKQLEQPVQQPTAPTTAPEAKADAKADPPTSPKTSVAELITAAHCVAPAAPVANGQPGPTGARMFMDDKLPSFFRRLCWSPDGSFLLVPAGQRLLESEAKVTATSAVNTTNLIQQRQSAEDNLRPGVWVFHRSNLKEPMTFIPTKFPSVAISFSPVLYKRRHVPPPPSPNSTAPPHLPYRMVFAVASTQRMIIFDTEHIMAIAVIKNIHLASITDITWSRDGQVVMASSADGYCTVASFDDGDLGEALEPQVVKTLEEEWASTRQANVTMPAPKRKRKRSAPTTTDGEAADATATATSKAAPAVKVTPHKVAVRRKRRKPNADPSKPQPPPGCTAPPASTSASPANTGPRVVQKTLSDVLRNLTPKAPKKHSPAPVASSAGGQQLAPDNSQPQQNTPEPRSLVPPKSVTVHKLVPKRKKPQQGNQPSEEGGPTKRRLVETDGHAPQPMALCQPQGLSVSANK